MLDPSGAAFWPGKRVLIAADPPFAAPTGFSARPVMQDPRAGLERLNRLVRLYRPAKVIMLGQGQPAEAPVALGKEMLAKLDAMAREASFIWVGGAPAANLPGQCVELHREGPFTFRHVPAARLAPREIEVSGFLQPKASIDARAKRISRPCFVTDAHRLVLPAFGAQTGGLDVRDPAIARLFPRGFRVFLLGQEQLFSFALEQLGRMAEVA